MQSASNRCDAGSEYAKHRSQGPRHRPALRKMRLQNALRLHRTGQTRLRTLRLRVHQMLEHAEHCDSALGLVRGAARWRRWCGIGHPETRSGHCCSFVLFLNQDWRASQSPEKGARAWPRNFSPSPINRLLMNGSALSARSRTSRIRCLRNSSTILNIHKELNRCRPRNYSAKRKPSVRWATAERLCDRRYRFLGLLSCRSTVVLVEYAL